jgi:hypothetical protein
MIQLQVYLHLPFPHVTAQVSSLQPSLAYPFRFNYHGKTKRLLIAWGIQGLEVPPAITPSAFDTLVIPRITEWEPCLCIFAKNVASDSPPANTMATQTCAQP